jgi:hypothetical protein
MKNDPINPFEVGIPEEILSDLQERLTSTQWPCSIDGVGWDAGADLEYLRELLATGKTATTGGSRRRHSINLLTSDQK